MTSAASGSDYERAYDDLRVNHVEDEICLVVMTDHSVHPEDLYETVRQFMNRAIPIWLTQPVPDPADIKDVVALQFLQHVGPDLVPTHLRPWVAELEAHPADGAGSRDPLLGLAHPADGQVSAWVRFARANQPTKLLCRYQLNLRDRLADPILVRQLVNLVNVRILRPSSQIGTTEFTLLAATPNWLIVTAGHASCVGPAGVPAVVSRQAALSPGVPPVRFGDQPAFTSIEEDRRRHLASALQAIDAGQAPPKPSNIVVAIVDTSPPRSQVAQAVERHPDNWLLKYVYETARFDPPFPERDLQFGGRFVPNWSGAEAHFSDESSEHFLMPDHGLFVAGIVRSLAPEAEIHLIRAVGDHGVCDLGLVAAILQGLPGRLLGEDPNRRLIVNLSLGADVPVRDRFLPRWFPLAHGLLSDRAAVTELLAAEQVPDDHAAAGFADLAHWGLRETIDWLTDHGVLVVAAAGNDRFIPAVNQLKDPRYPAHYQSVLGVTATKLAPDNGKVALADYANRGDPRKVHRPHGVATYGGNADLPGPGNGPPRIDVTAPVVDAIKGIFSADSLPLDGGSNETGWVYWAGTSFATPIISALAANLWARAGTTDNAVAIIDRLLELGVTVEDAAQDSSGSPDALTETSPDVRVIEARPS